MDFATIVPIQSVPADCTTLAGEGSNRGPISSLETAKQAYTAPPSPPKINAGNAEYRT